jgi:hypothetical protein
LARLLPFESLPVKEAGLMRKILPIFALIAAFSMTAFVPGASAQDRDQSNRARQERRVYDREHKDYHNWTRDEDRVYREYLTQQHRKYRDIERLSKKQQREYWRWRHDHEHER